MDVDEEQQAQADEDNMGVDAGVDAKVGAVCSWPCDGVQDTIIIGEVACLLLSRGAAPR